MMITRLLYYELLIINNSQCNKLSFVSLPWQASCLYFHFQASWQPVFNIKTSFTKIIGKLIFKTVVHCSHILNPETIKKTNTLH